MSKVFTAPEYIPTTVCKTIFLGGTIDNGESEDWQSEFIKRIDSSWNILNPRRKVWDSKLGEEEMITQINWELDALERADHIIINFLEDSKSPVSFLELGLFMHTGKVIVCCPENFYRSTNIYITCERYGAEVYKDLDTIIKKLNTEEDILKLI